MPPVIPEPDVTAYTGGDASEIHETVKRIEETVAKAADEPISDVRPNFAQAVAADDDIPTRAFQIVTDPDDDVDKTTQFSFDGFEKSN